MVMSLVLALALAASSESGSSGTCSQELVVGLQPGERLVHSPEAASSLAETLLSTIYGASNIRRQRPFKIIDEGKSYLVAGSLKKGSIGGVASIRICKISAKVVFIGHTK
jgi:hypothetical protein